MLRACGRQDGTRAELPSHGMDESIARAVLPAAMALTVVRPGVDVPGDVADYVTLT